VLKNSVLQVIANILSAVLNLLIIIFTAKTLGSLGRGEITYLIICVGILQIFTSIVGNSVMIFMLTRHKKHDVLFGSLIWTLIITFISIPFVYYFTTLDFKSIQYFLILGILQTSFSNLITFYSFELKFKFIILLKVAQPILFIFLIIGFYFLDKFNLSLYWTLLIVSFLPHFILFLIETLKNRYLITFSTLKVMMVDFLKLGGLGQFTNLMQFASYRFAVLIIAKTLGMNSVGVFGLWLSVTDAIWLIPMGLATVNMSYATKVGYELRNIYKHIIISVTISFFLILGILIIPNELYIYLLGKDFTQLRGLIIYSSPVVILFTINIVVAYYFSAKGLIKYNTLSSGLGFVAIIALTYYLTNNFGLLGAVSANCISYSFSILTTLYLFLKHKKQFNLDSAPLN
jgi:O-antigen/teichoic acid export membrane protein